MKRNLKKGLSVGLILIYMLSITPFPVLAEEELPSIEMSSHQFRDLLEQPGIRFSPTPPEPGPGEIVGYVHGEFGGGYIVGTPEAIGAALNAVGIALDERLVSDFEIVPLEKPLVLLALAGIGGLAGLLAYLLAPPLPEEEEVHPPAAHHHAPVHH